MGLSLKSVGAITLFVQDPQRSKTFYQTVFDAPTLIKPGAVAGREAGSRFQLTIWVDDADAVCAELARLGVGLLNGPMNREWGVRTATFTDPDGHIWEIAQELKK